MAEEGPGARRLSPHNKDPSLVTSYLPPNLQKAPCEPYKAPAPAACAAARRDGGSGGGPPPLPPGPPPPLGPTAPRMRSELRPKPPPSLLRRLPSPRGRAALLPEQGGTRGPPGAPFSQPPLPSFCPQRRLIPLTASPVRCPPGAAESSEQSPGCPRGRSPLPRVHLRRPAPDGAATARPLRGCPCRSRPPCGAVGPGGVGGVPLTIEQGEVASGD